MADPRPREQSWPALFYYLPHNPPPILPTCPLLALKSSDRDHTISDMTRRFLLLKAICQTCWNNICRMNCKQCVFFLNIAEIHDLFYNVILYYYLEVNKIKKL